MNFKEYYDKKYPWLDHKWYDRGELITDTHIRFLETAAEYIDEYVKNATNNINNHLGFFD